MANRRAGALIRAGRMPRLLRRVRKKKGCGLRTAHQHPIFRGRRREPDIHAYLAAVSGRLFRFALVAEFAAGRLARLGRLYAKTVDAI